MSPLLQIRNHVQTILHIHLNQQIQRSTIHRCDKRPGKARGRTPFWNDPRLHPEVQLPQASIL